MVTSDWVRVPIANVCMYVCVNNVTGKPISSWEWFDSAIESSLLSVTASQMPLPRMTSSSKVCMYVCMYMWMGSSEVIVRRGPFAHCLLRVLRNAQDHQEGDPGYRPFRF